ncbi:MAG: hypothetical protein KDC42_02000 [Ignavibacteriae bacterium]|nr:hypothetical protein [Ignavibacteriota bacterium]
MKKLSLLFILLTAVLINNGFAQSVGSFEEELAGARNQTLRINAVFSVATDNSAYGKEFFAEDIAIINSFNQTITDIAADLKVVDKNSNTAQAIENNNPNFGTTADVISKYIQGFERWATSHQDEVASYDGSGKWYEEFMKNANTAVSLAQVLDNELAEAVNEIRGHY